MQKKRCINIGMKSMASRTRRAFLDTNLVLDLLGKRPRHVAVEILLSKNMVFCITTLTVATAFYVTNRQLVVTVDDMSNFTSDFTILDVTAISLDKAYKIAADQDLEDAMQVAAAMMGKVDVFYTADAKLVKNYGHLMDIQLVS
jgi:predicted nucleic acid-binding protein